MKYENQSKIFFSETVQDNTKIQQSELGVTYATIAFQKDMFPLPKMIIRIVQNTATWNLVEKNEQYEGVATLIMFDWGISWKASRTFQLMSQSIFKSQ